jgi:hypothetical protein
MQKRALGECDVRRDPERGRRQELALKLVRPRRRIPVRVDAAAEPERACKETMEKTLLKKRRCTRKRGRTGSSLTGFEYAEKRRRQVHRPRPLIRRDPNFRVRVLPLEWPDENLSGEGVRNGQSIGFAVKY